MSLTTHLARRSYAYDAIVAQAPRLFAADFFNLAPDASMDQITTVLSAQDATLIGTAFDELQRFLVTGVWSSKPSWRKQHYVTHPVLPKLRNWAYRDAEPEETALLLAFFDQMRRIGTRRVTDSAHYGHLFATASVDEFRTALNPDLLPALRQLRALNEPVLQEWAARDPRHARAKFSSGWLLGGADADGVYGRSLIELKTTKTLTLPALRSATLQALGYALLDSRDAHKLEALEIWFAKQNYISVIPLAALVPDLPRARKEVKKALIEGMGAKTEAEARRMRKAYKEERRERRAAERAVREAQAGYFDPRGPQS